MRRLKRLFFGWENSDAETYRNIFEQYGGSINVHPDMVDFVAKRSGEKVSYFHCEKEGVIVGAYPVIGEKSLGADIWRRYPFSYDEILFPLEPSTRVWFPEKSNRLSHRLKDNIINANYTLARKNKVCIVKETGSPKSDKNRRNEFKRFLKSDGICVDQSSISAEELAALYLYLFNARFKGQVRCYEKNDLLDVIKTLRHLFFGKVLFIGDAPCAIDLALFSESSEKIYFDIPNGGVQPCYSDLSPGSLVMWKNIQAAKKMCEEKRKKMIFSIGALDENWTYKLRWANALRTGKTLF